MTRYEMWSDEQKAPYCDMCGGNLGHAAYGEHTCAKCLSINEQLAPPRHDRFCRCRTCKPPLGPSDQFIRRRRNPNLASPGRFAPTCKGLGDIVI